MHPLPTSWAGRLALLAPVAVLVALLGCGRAFSRQHAVVKDDVLATLRAKGEAAVMISLIEPTGIDAATEPARWRAEIARLQQSVLSQLPAQHFERRTLFASVPAIAGTLRTERGLTILTSNPNVRRVDLDVGGGGTSIR
jgi:hypothetical protein